VTAFLWWLGVVTPAASVAVVLAVFGLRVGALRFQLKAPGPWRGSIR
jgi:hypothetical protein